MKPLRVVLAVLALSVPLPAHAALIGLAGGDYDPPPITNPGPFHFSDCGVQTDDARLAGSVCVFYNAFDDIGDFEGFDSIFSLDLFLFGAEFAVGQNLFVSESSDLRRLANSTSFPGAFSLSEGSIAPPETPCEVECGPLNYTVALFLTPDEHHSFQSLLGLTTSNAAVNGIATVPEPATLLLMGPAALAMLVRRRRLRRK